MNRQILVFKELYFIDFENRIEIMKSFVSEYIYPIIDVFSNRFIS